MSVEGYIVFVPFENVASMEYGNNGAPDKVTVATTPGHLAGPFEVIHEYTLWKRKPGSETWQPAAHGTRDAMRRKLAEQPPDSEWRWTVTGPGEQP